MKFRGQEMSAVNRWSVSLPLAAVLLMCLLTTASPAGAGGVFRFAFFNVPESLDPTVDNSTYAGHVLNQVCDGLVSYDDNLRVVPGLAESWTVSRDGLLYTFHLRRGISFHDGRKLTSADVVFSLARLFAPDRKFIPEMLTDRIDGAQEYRQGKAGAVAGIRALAPYEVQVRLKEPYAPFLSALAMPIARIVPEGAAAGQLSRRPVGTGPFVLESWDDKGIVLTANDSYFRGRPILDEVIFRFYPQSDRDRAFADYLKGELDGCLLPGSADVDELRSAGHQVLIRPRLALLFYGMNVNRPPLDDARVRLALALGFDQRRHVEEELGGNYVVAYQVVPPGMPGYTPENATLKYDFERAAGLLAEAGYPGGKGLPDIEIATASSSDFARKEMSLLTADMARLGVSIKPVFVDSWETFTDNLARGAYSLFRYAFFADMPDPDDLLAALFTGGSPTNFTGFNDSEVNDILAGAKGEMDPVRRITAYREAEKRILEQAPLIPVLFLTTQVAFQPYVKGIALPATGTTNLPLYRVSVDR